MFYRRHHHPYIQVSHCRIVKFRGTIRTAVPAFAGHSLSRRREAGLRAACCRWAEMEEQEGEGVCEAQAVVRECELNRSPSRWRRRRIWARQGRTEGNDEESRKEKIAGRSLEMCRKESDAVTQLLQKPQCDEVRRGYQ